MSRSDGGINAAGFQKCESARHHKEAKEARAREVKCSLKSAMKDYSPQRHRVRREFNFISPLGVLSASAVTNPSESEFFLTRDTEFAEMFGLKSPQRPHRLRSYIRIPLHHRATGFRREFNFILSPSASSAPRRCKSERYSRQRHGARRD